MFGHTASPLTARAQPTSLTHTTPRYGAHFANLSAGTTYTLTIHDPSVWWSTTWSTTWSTSDAAPALHELEMHFKGDAS